MPPTVSPMEGTPVTLTACANVAVSSMTSPILLVLLAPLVTVTLGAVRLMLTPLMVTAGTASA